MQFSEGKPSVQILSTIGIRAGEDWVKEVIGNMAALTVMTSHKILDMLGEWILEENDCWRPKMRFMSKVEALESPGIRMPPAFERDPFLAKYALGLYKNLLPFRNAITHQRGVTIENQVLTVDANGTQKLSLDRTQVVALMRVAIRCVDILVGRASWHKADAASMKYDLDRVAPALGLPSLGQAQPHVELITVNVEVDSIAGSVTIDAGRVRSEARRLSPAGRDLFVELTVRAARDKDFAASWCFPDEMIPAYGAVSFTVGDYPERRIVQSSR
jgi:hypothetical protein